MDDVRKLYYEHVSDKLPAPKERTRVKLIAAIIDHGGPELGTSYFFPFCDEVIQRSLTIT